MNCIAGCMEIVEMACTKQIAKYGLAEKYHTGGVQIQWYNETSRWHFHCEGNIARARH